jgi:hypothetical protein
MAAFIVITERLPDHDLSKMNLQNVQLPTKLGCGWCKTERNVDWVYEEITDHYQRDRLSPIFIGSYDDTDAKLAYWIDENHGYVIQLILVNYENPINGRIHFSVNDPVGRLRKTNTNFQYNKSNIVPSDWDWVNKDADDEAVRCGGGTQDRCNGWFYLARYGQYYVWIKFFQDTNYQTFEEIVKIINDQVVLYLSQ